METICLLHYVDIYTDYFSWVYVFRVGDKEISLQITLMKQIMKGKRSDMERKTEWWKKSMGKEIGRMFLVNKAASIWPMYVYSAISGPQKIFFWFA